MKFTLLQTESKARAGEITTDSGTIPTPVFMPVGTLGNVKGVHFSELEKIIGADIILGNTYHLYLKPGTEVLEQAGGLSNFNQWKKPILTDSGGYQVYSLAKIRKISPEGVKFQSHIDGSTHLFTPEKAVDIQRSIGADIIMAFDECPPNSNDYTYAKKSLELTHDWLAKCFARFKSTQPKYGKQQALFPIVQGSLYKDLRTMSIDMCSTFNSIGIAIGGLAVGESIEEMYDMTAFCCEHMPQDRARYLMGVGTPENILNCIEYGVDMFDCVMPTRNGRNGMIFTKKGIINIKNLKWKKDFSPLDEESDLELDKSTSKSFLRHLFNSNEMLGAQIASVHNLHFYCNLVKEARKQILEGNFSTWKNNLKRTITDRL